MIKIRIISYFLVFLSYQLFCQTDTSYTYGKYGFGFEFAPGTGFYSSSNESKNIFCERYAANIGLIFSFKKFQFIPRIGGIYSELNKNIFGMANWKEGYNFSSLNLEFATGYEIVNMRFISTSPYISVGATSFNIDYESELLDISERTNNSFQFSYGIEVDFKLNCKVSEKHRFPGCEHETQYWMIRFIFGSYPRYFFDQLNLRGDVYFIKICAGGLWKPRSIIIKN